MLLVGATGDFGFRIATALSKENIHLKIALRKSSQSNKIDSLRKLDADLLLIDFADVSDLITACEGVHCVISALSGLEEVIVDTQKRLLDAAIESKVAKFIPSDFSADFTTLPEGLNRNFDQRRRFHCILDASPIQATSIFNGAFMEMLLGEAPFILFLFKRILYWGSAEQKLDFTSKDDVARYTAAAAIDNNTPRYLRISGQETTARVLASITSKVTGKEFGLFRAGTLNRLSTLIRIAKLFSNKKNDVSPPMAGNAIHA